MMKHSKQRDCIYNYLVGRKDHPTAETVYLAIREEMPKVSLGTVYRNLTLLAELGEIQKISIMNGPDRFDGNAEPHHHFICTDCGSVIDLEMDSIDYINEMAGKSFGGKITGHSVLFHGSCPMCLKAQAN